MGRLTRRLALTVAALSVLPAVSADAAGAQDGGSYFCLRGSPKPACRGFLRVEVRGGGSVAESPRYHYVGVEGPNGAITLTDSIAWYDVGDWIGVEVGYALNIGDRWAVGASAAVETGNETTRHIARARVRRWLTGRAYAEVLPGVLRQRRDLFYRSGDALEDNAGLTVEARVGLSGLGFVSGRYDVLDIDPLQSATSGTGRFRRDLGGTAQAFSMGGGLEGRTAIIAAGAAFLIGVGVAFFAALPAT